MKLENFKPGWTRQDPDERDIKYQLRHIFKKLPSSASVEPMLPRVFDQGDLGSCTAHAGVTALMAVFKKEGIQVPELSRLFLYYYIREQIGKISVDSGGRMRDIFKCANAKGVALEIDWPYLIQQFRLEPSAAAKLGALKYKALKYESLPQGDINAVKDCIASGFPVIFGMDIYTSFFNIGRSGVMPMPSGRLEGGHAIVVYGYTSQYLFVRNSWGPSWGKKGNFKMHRKIWESPKYCDDVWTCKLAGA